MHIRDCANEAKRTNEMVNVLERDMKAKLNEIDKLDGEINAIEEEIMQEER